MISTFLYCLKQGVINICRNILFSLASVATISACIFLFCLFFSLIANIQNMTYSAETKVGITIFFNEDLSEEEILSRLHHPQQKMRKTALDACKKLKINAGEGVYLAATGPNFETPAEIRAFKKLGATVVGMSVVPEVLAARQCGILVLGLAWVSNMGCGIEKTPLSHAQTISETKKIEGKFKKLLEILFVKL